MPPRCSLRRLLAIALSICGAVALAANPSPGMAERNWTPSDSIGVRYFDTEGAVISPHGDRFFFVTQYGSLADDSRVSELVVFNTSDVRRTLTDRTFRAGRTMGPSARLVRRSPIHNQSGILAPQWDPDGKSVSFQGVDHNGVQQYYQFNVESGEVTALTRWSYQSIYMEHSGKTIIAELLVPTPAAKPLYPSHPFTQDELNEPLTTEPGEVRRRVFLFASYGGEKPWELKAVQAGALFFQTSFSSAGTRAIVVLPPRDPPVGWSSYDGASAGDLSQFRVVDAEHERAAATLDAPSGLATRVGRAMLTAYPELLPHALWIDDGHVVLVNTCLPISPEHRERAAMAYVASYDDTNATWQEVEPLRIAGRSGTVQVSSVHWDALKRELLIAHQADGIAFTTHYRLRAGRWSKTLTTRGAGPAAYGSPNPSALPSGLTVTLHQSSNEAPVMIASLGGHQVSLTDPDPSLIGVRRAAVQPFQWTEPDGRRETGGLLLPLLRARTTVPLVIQAFRQDPAKFLPDGPDPLPFTYAAQALVARGMAVLNISLPMEDIEGSGATPREEPEFVARVDSAIDALNLRGEIDPARVGLVGFSRAGFMAYYAITHPGTHPLAAVIADDSVTGSFDEYLSGAALYGPDYVQQTERMYGGAFWTSRDRWLQAETDFNVDRVRTPALFTAHQGVALQEYRDVIGAFALNGRPLEFLVYPNSGHPLRLPRQRLASMEATVEWMAFWLLGELPPDADRATRWLRLRREQETVINEAAKKGEKIASLPEPHDAPDWAIEAWRATHRLIGDLASDGKRLIAKPSASY